MQQGDRSGMGPERFTESELKMVLNYAYSSSDVARILGTYVRRISNARAYHSRGGYGNTNIVRRKHKHKVVQPVAAVESVAPLTDKEKAVKYIDLYIQAYLSDKIPKIQAGRRSLGVSQEVVDAVKELNFVRYQRDADGKRHLLWLGPRECTAEDIYERWIKNHRFITKADRPTAAGLSAEAVVDYRKLPRYGPITRKEFNDALLRIVALEKQLGKSP